MTRLRKTWRKLQYRIFTLAKFAALCLAIIVYLLSTKIAQINEIDLALMSICAETHGCFEIGAESGEPNANCVYARLIQLGCASQSLDSADEGGGLSTTYIYRLVRPGTPPETAIWENASIMSKIGYYYYSKMQTKNFRHNSEQRRKQRRGKRV